jgi:hypothetical protein
MFRIKSLRLGNFRSILEMLGPEEQADNDTTGPSAASARSGLHFGGAFPEAPGRISDHAPDRPAYVPLDRLARLYGEQRPQGAQQPVAPADDATIAAELRLSSARSGEDLRRIRRRFAMSNHPDRVPAWLRDEATRRMTIANALIDRAMRERQRKRFRG